MATVSSAHRRSLAHPQTVSNQSPAIFSKVRPCAGSCGWRMRSVEAELFTSPRLLRNRRAEEHIGPFWDMFTDCSSLLNIERVSRNWCLQGGEAVWMHNYKHWKGEFLRNLRPLKTKARPRFDDLQPKLVIIHNTRCFYVKKIPRHRTWHWSIYINPNQPLTKKKKIKKTQRCSIWPYLLCPALLSTRVYCRQERWLFRGLQSSYI